MAFVTTFTPGVPHAFTFRQRLSLSPAPTPVLRHRPTFPPTPVSFPACTAKPGHGGDTEARPDAKATLTPSPSAPQEPGFEQKRRDVAKLLALFVRLARPYWTSEATARRDLAALLVLALLQSGVSVAISYVSRDFWTALNTRDLALFYRQAGLFAGALALATPVVAGYGYVRDRSALRWREWLTARVVGQYCAGRNFYRLEAFADSQVDNPDQRIAQDLNAFATESITFALTLLVSSVDLVCFSAILFSIYPLLFAVLLAYSASGTLATAAIGRDLLARNYAQLVREADLRYGLVRLRDNAESVAFFGGEAREAREIGRRLQAVVDNLSAVIDTRRNLAFLQTAYRYTVQVLPALCVAPRYFAGDVPLGAVTQSFSAFNHILNDLSLVVNRFDALSQFGAGIDRLAQFVDALERHVPDGQRVFSAAAAGTAGDESRGEVNSHSHANGSANGVSHTAPDADKIQLVRTPSAQTKGAQHVVAVRDLVVRTPPGSVRRVLVDGVSFSLRAGDRLLVAGPSGAGKSSLLRAVAGLWESGGGVIECPAAGEMFFLPQKPYCTLGSLRDNLLYPRDATSTTTTTTDAALHAALRDVDLADLPARMGGLDAVADWADVLSLGEQQRLQFARLFLAASSGSSYAAPSAAAVAVAVIDEGSAALSVDAERAMYAKIQALGVTVISVGHRPSLVNYHDYMLRLKKEDGAGSGVDWEWSVIEEKDRDAVSVKAL